MADLAVRNPADASLVGHVPYGGAADAKAAADAAAAAFAEWSRTEARTRADALVRASELLRARADEIGRLLTRETGKRLPEAIGEVRFAAEYFRWFAEEARRPSGAVIPHEAPDRRHLTFARPAGVAVCLTPWNFPVSIQARKVAAALAAGCTVVSRTSEKAPLAVVELFRCLAEAGVPADAARLVHGPAAELTAALLDHPAVRVVSFTGSTEVGRSIMRLAARRMVRPLLELGGDAPFIVFADCDLDRAVEGAVLAKFRNNGQSCIAANRFYVERSIEAAFVRRLAQRVDAMRVGDPLGDPAPDLGPLIDEERKRAVSDMVAEAIAAGARSATRTWEPLDGRYLGPALLTHVTPAMRIGRAEVFGPAAAIIPFSNEREAIALANGTEMGLAAYVYTSDLDRAWRMCEALEAGIVGLNDALPSVAFAPMGGMKQSGMGREGARAGLDDFSEITYVATRVGTG